MPRKPGIWERNTPAGVVYYTTLNGQQIRLSDQRDEAERKFALLTDAGVPGDVSRAEEVCDEFLEHVQANRTKKTYRVYSHFLNSFCGLYGSVLVCELARRHATKWLDQAGTWNPSTKAYAGSVLKVCFGWAVAEGLISKNPFATLKKSGEIKRERVLTDGEWRKLLGEAREPFKTFLIGLRLSGCRPGEQAAVTDKMVDLEAGCWKIDLHKTREKTKEPRLVWLCPELLELTKTLMQPGGYLFKNNAGGRWSGSSLVNAFARLRKRCGLGKDVVIYTIRHTFASDAIEHCDIATVAELLGHKSLNTTVKTYVHLRKKGTFMRDAARKAVSGCAAGGGQDEPRPGNP